MFFANATNLIAGYVMPSSLLALCPEQAGINQSL